MSMPDVRERLVRAIDLLAFAVLLLMTLESALYGRALARSLLYPYYKLEESFGPVWSHLFILVGVLIYTTARALDWMRSSEIRALLVRGVVLAAAGFLAGLGAALSQGERYALRLFLGLATLASAWVVVAFEGVWRFREWGSADACRTVFDTVFRLVAGVLIPAGLAIVAALRYLSPFLLKNNELATEDFILSSFSVAATVVGTSVLLLLWVSFPSLWCFVIESRKQRA